MEDNELDDLFKSSLEGLEDPQLLEAGLSSFRNRLDGKDGRIWYQGKWWNKHIGKGLVLLLLLSLIGNGYLLTRSQENIGSKTIQNSKESIIDGQIHELQQEISILRKNLEKLSVTNSQLITANTSTNQQIALLSQNQEREIQSLEHLLKIRQTELITLSEEQIANSSLTQKDNSIQSFLQFLQSKYSAIPSFSSETLLVPNSNQEQNERLLAKDEGEETNNLLNASTSKKLDQHFNSGFSPNIAPTIGFLNSKLNGVSKGNAPIYGLALRGNILPNLKLESGVNYQNFQYEVFNADDIQKFGFVHDPNLGEINAVEIQNKLIGIPLMLKYQTWLGSNSRLLLGGGTTSYFSVGRETDYEYLFLIPGTSEAVSLTEGINEDKIRYNHQSLDLSIGIQKRFNNNRWFELSFFFQKDLKKFGKEEASFNNFGLRTYYWLGK